MSSSTEIPAGGSLDDLPGSTLAPVGQLTDSVKGVVDDLKDTAAGAIQGASDAVLSGTGGVFDAVARSIIGGFVEGTDSVISANPQRIGDSGFDDDRAGVGNPIPGQPQKTKLDMTPLYSITNPASDYWPLQPDEMNTPRLARGVTKDTITEAQQMSRTAVVTATGFKLEPASPYAAEYPFNTVEESESGHFREVDDTPGAERIKESHRTGTFYEIHPDGQKVTKVVNDNFTAIMGDDSLSVTGSCRVMVTGGCSLFASGGVDVYAATGINLFAASKITTIGSQVQIAATGPPVPDKKTGEPLPLISLVAAGGDMLISSTGVITFKDSTGVDVGAMDLIGTM